MGPDVRTFLLGAIGIFLFAASCVSFNHPQVYVDGILPGESRIFVSSTGMISGGLGLNASLDPIGTADGICAAAKQSEGLTLTYKAILSITTSTYLSRATSPTNAVYVFDSASSRRLVANTLSSMFSGAGTVLASGISRDEHYNDATGNFVWTGTQNNGTVGGTCTDWTDGASPGVKAIYGTAGSTTSTWVQQTTGSCGGSANKFYCIAQR